MLREAEQAAIERLWTRKVDQDAAKLPLAERHRNLEPESAAFIHVTALGRRATRLLEIGGSTGISTIALASAARETGGRLVSIEVVAERQRESRDRLAALGLDGVVDFVNADADSVLDRLGPMDFVLIDCEKEDYIRFFDRLRLEPGSLVVADNILSHALTDYTAHVRRKWPSVTLQIGKGLELTAVPPGGAA